MERKLPNLLTDMNEVAYYWRSCVFLLDEGIDERLVASYMVGVASNPRDEEWSNGAHADWHYAEIFELVASLETPFGDVGSRKMQWEKVKSLLAEM